MKAAGGGFTLIELIVTVAILAILATLAVPAFTSTVRRNCAATSANAMLGLLTYARGEAVKRGVTVGLCPSTDGSSCGTDTDWGKGTMAYLLDSAGNQQVLRADIPITTCASIASTNLNPASPVQFTSTGRMQNSHADSTKSGGLTATPKQHTAISRFVTVDPIGHIKVCDPTTVSQC